MVGHEECRVLVSVATMSWLPQDIEGVAKRMNFGFLEFLKTAVCHWDRGVYDSMPDYCLGDMVVKLQW